MTIIAHQPISYRDIERLYMSLLRAVHQSRLPSPAKALRYIEINSALDYTRDEAKYARLLMITMDVAEQIADVQL